MIVLVKNKGFNQTHYKSSISVGSGGGNSPTSPNSSSGSNNPGSVPTTPDTGTRNAGLTPGLLAGGDTNESKTTTPVTPTPVTFEETSYSTPEPKTTTQNPETQRPTQNSEVPPNEVPLPGPEIPWTPDEPRDPAELEQLSKFFGYFFPPSGS